MASVTKVPTGWRARWRTADGSSRSKTFKRKVDAEHWLTEIAHAQQIGGYVDPGQGKLLFGRFVEEVFRPTIKGARSTVARDESYLRSLILPYFAKTPLAAIDYVACQEWVNKLEAAGKAPETVHKAAQIMRRAMTTAIKARRLQANPMLDIEMTPIGEHEAIFLEPDQVEALADAMEAVAPRYRALVWVGCYCGPRIGELIALRWSDVNLLKGTVSIVKNTSEVEGHQEDGRTKTKAGRRIVRVPAGVIAELVRHRDRFPSPDRVFTSPDGGPIRANNLRRRAWANATVRAGLATRQMVPRLDPETGEVLMDGRGTGKPRMRAVVTGMTFHDMRHTAVALWIATGANDLQVARWAGHKSVTFTKDRYGHLFDTHGDAVVARLDALIAEASARPSARVVGLESLRRVSDPCHDPDDPAAREDPQPLCPGLLCGR